MEKGTVAWFDASKGFGFVKRKNAPDIFVHFTGIAGDGYKNLNEGDSVEFEVTQGRKGEQASNVKRVEQGDK